MFFLVRKSVLGSKDEFQDLDFDTNTLIIGNQGDPNLNLSDLNSGTLSISPTKSNKAKFICSNELSLSVDDKEKTSGMIVQGETYQLGIYDLEIILPPAGFDFAISISRSKRKTKKQKIKFQIDNTKKRVNLRLVSYVIFLSIIGLFLISPLYLPQKTLNELPIPSDLSWSSGPMSMAHRIPEIGDDCKICHVKPFEKVPDKQCTNCHRNLGDHVASNHPAVDDIEKFICENCHKEHNEPMQITRSDNAFCIDCHQEIDKFSDTTNDQTELVQSVNGFNSQNHPPFRLSLLQPELINGNYQWKNTRNKFNPNVITKEQSNLKFSHNVHLDVEMVQDNQTGEQLACNNCHQLKADKEHFKPITMDKDCRSCHKLTFDVFNPDIELPHGNLRAAAVMLQAHFIREFTDQELRQRRSLKKKRRIPGKHSNSATCQGNGLDCGRAEALKESQYQFTTSGCITCHEVVEYSTSDPLAKWFVKPIRITDDWYSKAKFDHVSHFSVKEITNEDEICLNCHEVEDSDESSDIAMPQQNKCLECHQQDIHNSVELSCIRCHEFHIVPKSR